MCLDLFVEKQQMLTLDWSTVLGGGFVITVLLLALVERLRRTFATKDQLNGFGHRVNELTGLYQQVREAVDDARDAVRSLEAEQRHQTDRLNRQVIDPLERISIKLQELTKSQIEQASAVKHIERWIDRDQTRAVQSGASPKGDS
jgi:hypothetical protein